MSSDFTLLSAHERRLITLSLLVLYVIWGSTYLGMRFALQTFPPFTMGGLRFTLAGTALYLWQRQRGVPVPSWRQWRNALCIGTLLFGMGNGFVAFAQRHISSGVAAIVIATVPLWSVLFAALWGSRPTGSELLGLALGLASVALLQRGGAFAGDLPSSLALLCAPIAWAFGSLWGARLDLPRGAMGSATQMMTGGFVMGTLGVLSGERMKALTWPALLAFAYLVTMGSLLAFSAYQYLLARTRPALATSYAFVNPAVALVLGASIAGEPLDLARLGACAVTALAVVFVLRSRYRRA